MPKYITILSIALAALLITIGASATSGHSAQSSTAPITCQLSPQADRTIVHFNNEKLRADLNQSDSTTNPITTTIEPGHYQVTLMSYDSHSSQAPHTQPLESWQIILKDSGNVTVATTAAISDLPDDTDTLVEKVDSDLYLTAQAKSATAVHIAYPATSANSVTPVCAAFDKFTPTPSPSPSPTPSPISEPDDDDEDEDSNNSDDVSLSITKTDHRDITRPKHTLTYEIQTENTGEGKIEDIEVTDTIPSAVTITSVSNDGKINGRVISWPEFALSGGEKVTFYATVSVNENTSNGHTLTNTVKARSEDKGISANDTDTTVVETNKTGQVISTSTIEPQSAAVPVTAATGAGPLAAVISLLGGTSLAHLLRHHWL